MIITLKRKAFTLLELVFVIIIMGVIGKFGVEFLAQAYKSFIFSKINNELQSNSAYATEVIAKKLEHRIKQSAIYRNPTLGNSDVNFASLESGTDPDATVLEWIASDIDGYRGDGNISVAYWSGVIDLNTTLTNATQITSLHTDTTKIDTFIKALSDNGSTIDDVAIYFIGTFTANNEWGWDGDITKFDTLSNMDIYPLNDTGVANRFIPAPKSDTSANSLTGVSATEYYKLAWTANAISLEDFNATTNTYNMYFYHNYQPWKGEQYDDTGIGIQKDLLMNNVSSFQFRAAGSLVKIQVCTKSSLIANEEYSICKEKTVY